jgi:cell division protein FtsQ
MSIRKFILIIIPLILAVIAIIYFANKWRNNTNYTEFRVSGNYTLTKDEILTAANIKPDSSVNIDDLNIMFIQDRILKHPEIKKVYVSKNPPSQIIIDVVEKRPVAIVNSGNELYLVDEEYEMFPFKNYEKIYDLPVINCIGQENFQPGRKEKEEDLKLAIFIVLNSYIKGKFLYNQISEINMADSEKVVMYMNDNNLPFYFPRYKERKISDFDYQKEILQCITIFKNFIEKMHSEISEKSYAYVDLRFNGQIIVKTN